MILPMGQLNDILALKDWRSRWVRRGMVCVQDGPRAMELDRLDYSGNIDAVGCGGWTESGELHWVGIDLDVGHGGAKNCYESRDDALDAAFKVRAFVGNAAEIRLSKSGSGVHIRIAIEGVATNGRETAPHIAKWLVATLEIKCDPTVLGRQNLWFWARQSGAHSFQEIEPCEGKWCPPPAALKPPAVLQMPPAAAPSNVAEAERIRKASQYMAKVAPAIEKQGGHIQALKAATLLLIGFDLTIAQGYPIYYAWAQQCIPPWSDKEIAHKLSEADKNTKGYPRGYKLNDKPKTPAAVLTAEVHFEEPAMRASVALTSQIEEEISGSRFAAEFPWPSTTERTRALMPGTVTVFCAPQGSSKSFFVIQAGQHWYQKGYTFAILMLEEDRNYHVRRALGQYIEDQNIGKPDWCKSNPEKVRALLQNNADFIDGFGRHIYEVGGSISTDAVLDWVTRACDAGTRIIVIDPITARDPSDRPWIDDHKFMRTAAKIIKQSQSSLVLVTHPPKNSGVMRGGKEKGWGDDVAGGAAFLRFAQTVLWLEYMPEAESVEYLTKHGIAEGMINRRLQLRKTRNSDGQGYVIGFFFNGKTTKFEERGIVDR